MVSAAFRPGAAAKDYVSHILPGPPLRQGPSRQGQRGQGPPGQGPRGTRAAEDASRGLPRACPRPAPLAAVTSGRKAVNPEGPGAAQASLCEPPGAETRPRQRLQDPHSGLETQRRQETPVPAGPDERPRASTVGRAHPAGQGPPHRHGPADGAASRRLPRPRATEAPASAWEAGPVRSRRLGRLRQLHASFHQQ